MTKNELIKLIDDYWKFDENQQHMSSWHDKQDLLKRLESDLNSVIRDELEKFALHINGNCITDITDYLSEDDIDFYLNQII